MSKISTLFLCLSVFLTTIHAPTAYPKEREVRYEKFQQPFCMIGDGSYKTSFKRKLSTLRRYQRKISRKLRDFRNNLKRERKANLHGSPKWIVIKYLRHRGFTWKEVDFYFYALTLFGEARNLKNDDIEMVAKVINNRRGKKTYRRTVTELAQFSSWYYKNQYDNVVMLCPSKTYHKHWSKIVNVAKKHFYKDDDQFNSTHYYAPYNMVPRYTVPNWARGKYGVVHGGHVFIIPKDEINKYEERVFYIPKSATKAKISGDKLVF